MGKKKNSIDIYTSQHVYPASSLGDFPPERFILVLVLVKGVKLRFDFMARILPYYKQEMGKESAFRVG